MSIDNTSEKSVDLDRQENLTKGNLSAKKVAMYYYDAGTDTLKPGIGGDINISGTGLATENKQNDTITAVKNVSAGLTELDLFGAGITATRYNHVEIDFAQSDPDVISDITVTKTSGGDAVNASGQAVFSTGTNATGGIKAVTNNIVEYRPHNESYAAFTAIFTAGVANSYQRIGIYDNSNGFFIGYEGTSFGITIRSSSVDTTVAKGSFNVDTLAGGASSKFTRNGVPEALDPTKDNLYRIRFGWLGASAIYFEVLSPDQQWIVFHKHRVANSATVPSIANPNLPITLDARKTSGSTNIVMSTACWAGGTTCNMMKVTSTITNNTLAPLQRSVITGYSSAGGGSYNNVKVTPSGSMTIAIGDITGVDGQATMATSFPVVIASDQSAIPVTTGLTDDPLVKYKISDTDSSSDPKYYGNVAADGSWYIMKETTSAGTYRYCKGASSYSTNWTGRASLTYDYFDVIF